MDKLAKAFDEASSDLASAIGYSPDLVKASHEAMHHHALHAIAASRAGKMDEAAKHGFMHMRHAVENARDSGYYDMGDKVTRNIDHYKREAADELGAASRAAYGSSPVSPVDRARHMEKHMHPVEKHFHKGGGFVPHKGDSSFKEDYKGQKAGPKMGKK